MTSQRSSSDDGSATRGELVAQVAALEAEATALRMVALERAERLERLAQALKTAQTETEGARWETAVAGRSAEARLRFATQAAEERASRHVAALQDKLRAAKARQRRIEEQTRLVAARNEAQAAAVAGLEAKTVEQARRLERREAQLAKRTEQLRQLRASRSYRATHTLKRARRAIATRARLPGR